MKVFKLIISALLVLYSFNFLVINGQAAETSAPTNATQITNLDGFSFDVDFTDSKKNSDNTYGKYYLINLPEYV